MMRGYRVEELIGNIGYGELVYLLIMGELPSREKGRLLEAALVAGADHGIPAPSVAVSRIAATCGIPLNCSVATGINLLGDIHGGAAEQLMKILYELNEKIRTEGGREKFSSERPVKNLKRRNSSCLVLAILSTMMIPE